MDVPGLPKTISDYGILEQHIDQLSETDKAELYRRNGKKDLFFLLRYILSTSKWKDPEDTTRSFWDKQWLLDRCREIQFDSDGVLDIWARYHGKSTIKTFGFMIQILLNDPNATVGVFSVTKMVADAFVQQVKFELESNQTLQALYPDRFYAEPRKEAGVWTVEKGFTIKRPLNLKDASMRGFGLVDTSFTGHRISHAIYDDAVNEQSITTADMVEKVNVAWELSLNVGMPGSKRYYIGTFYAHGDSYHHMAQRGVRLRLHPCYKVVEEKSVYDQASGLPVTLHHDRDNAVLFSGDHLRKEEKLMGPGTFGVQMLCDPNAGALAGFRHEWLQYYGESPDRVRKRCNVVVLVDPASEKKKHNSRTAMWVVGLGDDENYYILDAVIDRLDLDQRTETLFRLVAQWRPNQVRYEKYSMQADIQHVQYVQEQQSFRFPITEVGGNLSKDDRIQRLVPLFAQRKVYFPNHIWYRQVDDDKLVNITERFIHDEYLVFPNSIVKDGLDALSRICESDLHLPWPRPREFEKNQDVWLKELRKKQRKPQTDWMMA
jgi:hypothetical protein